MNGVDRLTLVLIASAAIGCAAPGQEPLPSNEPRRVIVQFGKHSLHPAVARMKPGATVRWINYAPDYTGAIVFSESFGTALSCSEPGPGFTKVATGYRSTPIAGDLGEGATLPCPLEPGEYKYEIYLWKGLETIPEAEIFAPDRKLHGKIVVD